MLVRGIPAIEIDASRVRLTLRVSSCSQLTWRGGPLCSALPPPRTGHSMNPKWPHIGLKSVDKNWLEGSAGVSTSNTSGCVSLVHMSPISEPSSHFSKVLWLDRAGAQGLHVGSLDLIPGILETP